MHHAYVIVGDSVAAVKYLKKKFLITAPLRYFPSFGIGESRTLKAEQTRRLGPDEQSVVAISCDVMTAEAQNALLKTLEEPSPNVHFFFIFSDIQNLLPTLLSRCEVVKLTDNAEVEISIDPDKFIAASPEERLMMVTNFVKEHEADETLRLASQQLATELLRRKPSAELDRAVNYLYDRAALPRLVLEHLAVVI